MNTLFHIRDCFYSDNLHRNMHGGRSLQINVFSEETFIKMFWKEKGALTFFKKKFLLFSIKVMSSSVSFLIFTFLTASEKRETDEGYKTG